MHHAAVEEGWGDLSLKTNLGPLLAAVVCAAFWTLPCQAAEPDDAVTLELRQRAVETLRETMRTEERWVKVHAAEFLLELDYREGVQETFEKERSLFEAEPEYRIGIWRVLARSAAVEQDRRGWVNKIRDVFADPDAPDRLHAVETLAKLKYEVKADDEALFRQASDSPDKNMAAYAAWVLANSGKEDAILQLAQLLESDESGTRASAAYALRHLPELPIEVKDRLAAALKREPTGESARVHVVCAAAVHLPEEQGGPLRNELVELAGTGSTGDKYQACETLGAVGDQTNLAALTVALEDESIDVHSAAATAILRIERRGRHGMKPLDWTVIGLYVVGMLVVGWYYSRQTKTSDDYLLGGRNMRPVSVGLSLFATLLSTITYLSIPGEIIRYGPMILAIMAAFPLVYLIAGWLMIPFIMRLKITSAYELLETRLGLGVRMLGSTFFLAMRLLWMAVIIFATTENVLVPLLGLPPSSTPYLCAVLGIITVVYTSMGGLRAVVLTDVMQTLILFGGAILTVGLITRHFGGFGGWWPSGWISHWPDPEFGLGSESTTRITFLSAALAQFTWWTCTAGSDQMAIQRYLATRDAKAARAVLLTSLVANAFVYLILAATGMCMLAYFTENPHMLADGQTILGDADALFSRFIAIGLPAGVSGLVVAGLLAAAMSSLSSGVNSSCSVISVDFIKRFRKPVDEDAGSNQVKLNRIISVAVGVVVIALSSLVGAVEGNLLVLAFKLVNLLTAPLFGLFFMAMFVRWATQFGTLVGAAFGLAVVVAVNYWKEFTGTQGISFMWAMPLSLLVQIAVGSLLSLLPIGERRRMLDGR